MNPAENSSRTRKKPRHLLRKLELLSLLTAAYALGLLLLLDEVSWFPLILFSYFSTGIVAVIGGLGTRLLLSKRHWLIRTFSATTMPLIGLSVLGYFSDWKIGIDIISLSRGYVSLSDQIHLILSITISWATLWAWYRSVPKDVESSTSAEPVRQVVVPQPQRVRQPRSWSLRPRTRVNSEISVRSGNGSRPQVHARPKLVTKQPTRSRRRSPIPGRAHNLHLAVVEEHRCPYCLEPVSRNNPGGVKECEICHSLHHADCWAVTGTCQVPHLNN